MAALKGHVEVLLPLPLIGAGGQRQAAFHSMLPPASDRVNVFTRRLLES